MNLTPGGRLGKLVVRGKTLTADVAEAVTGATLDLSASEVSQLTVTISDPELKLLGARLFTAGTPTAAGSSVDYGPLKLECRSVEVGSGPSLTIVARDLGAYKLKRFRGPLVRKNLSPTESAAIDAKAAGLKFVGEPSARRPTVVRAKDETAWDAIGRHADEIGYLRFVSAGVLYFARPTFLVKRPADLLLAWATSGRNANPLLRDIPACKRSGDDANGTAGFSAELLGELGDKALPGMAVDLRGVPTFDGRYLIDSVNVTLDDVSPVAITAVTPLNPEPNPPDASSSSSPAVAAGKGTAEQFVGFALAQAGDRYVLGAETKASDPDPDAFDCSELVQWAAARAGAKIVDGSSAQLAAVKRVTVAVGIKTRGALLFHPGHVAISLGNGKTIEARGRKYGVVEASAAGRFTAAGLVPGLRYG